MSFEELYSLCWAGLVIRIAATDDNQRLQLVALHMFGDEHHNQTLVKVTSTMDVSGLRMKNETFNTQFSCQQAVAHELAQWHKENLGWTQAAAVVATGSREEKLLLIELLERLRVEIPIQNPDQKKRFFQLWQNAIPN